MLPLASEGSLDATTLWPPWCSHYSCEQRSFQGNRNYGQIGGESLLVVYIPELDGRVTTSGSQNRPIVQPGDAINFTFVGIWVSGIATNRLEEKH